MPMAMPAQTSQVCLKKDRKAEDTIPKQDDCRVTDMNATATTEIFTYNHTLSLPDGLTISS